MLNRVQPRLVAFVILDSFQLVEILLQYPSRHLTMSGDILMDTKRGKERRHASEMTTILRLRNPLDKDCHLFKPKEITERYLEPIAL